MPRRLNYTGRQRISRRDVSIRLRQGTNGLKFDADFRFNSNTLKKIMPPPSLYVEAYRGAHAIWKRFDFGSIAAIQPPTDRSLNEFVVPEGILFRVKVSDKSEDSLGRLLAEADSIRPTLPDEQETFGQPLIQHMPAEDIGDELWRLELTGDIPLLKINSRIPMGIDQFLRDPKYRAIFAPAVMRQVLTNILIIDRSGYDEEDDSCWQILWLNFASHLTGAGKYPEAEEENNLLINAEEITTWIDAAVEAFMARSHLFSAFSQSYAQEDS